MISSSSDPSHVASPANRVSFTSLAVIWRRFCISTVFSALEDIAKLSPWLVPSVDGISAPPTMINLEGIRWAFVTTSLNEGHVTWILCNATFLLKLLNALLVSIKIYASVEESSKMSDTV